MTVFDFIKHKASQLAYYLRAFWRDEIAYLEVNHFFWDTMEEWVQIKHRHRAPSSSQERVFWHLMHQIHYWPQEQLHSDRVLKVELARCVHYLENGGFCPFDCIGIRP